ncbi:MAG: hypothetical protein Q8N83_16290 [Ignavibacteria bacterium]|nr:hypothetical protein [Ignavibacteria bacterium]
MENISSVQEKVHSEISVNFKNPFLLRYVFYPLRAGLFGFSLFFTTIFISKYVGYLVKNTKTFTIDINDVVLSLLGFILLGLIKLLENIKSEPFGK